MFEISVLGKNRLVFKSFLYDYVAKKSGPEFKKGRQDAKAIDCVPDSTGKSLIIIIIIINNKIIKTQAHASKATRSFWRVRAMHSCSE